VRLQSATAPLQSALKAVMHSSNGSGVAKAPAVSRLVWKPLILRKGGQTGITPSYPGNLDKAAQFTFSDLLHREREHLQDHPFLRRLLFEARPAFTHRLRALGTENHRRTREVPQWKRQTIRNKLFSGARCCQISFIFQKKKKEKKILVAYFCVVDPLFFFGEA
jgi:hypothetical protein